MVILIWRREAAKGSGRGETWKEMPQVQLDMEEWVDFTLQRDGIIDGKLYIGIDAAWQGTFVWRMETGYGIELLSHWESRHALMKQ